MDSHTNEKIPNLQQSFWVRGSTYTVPRPGRVGGAGAVSDVHCDPTRNSGTWVAGTNHGNLVPPKTSSLSDPRCGAVMQADGSKCPTDDGKGSDGQGLDGGGWSANHPRAAGLSLRTTTRVTGTSTKTCIAVLQMSDRVPGCNERVSYND
ncbi:hypothetical protein BDN67DRAFT_360803 [Paxillus ammoniavirescens]|nr:hypothetical protein BDN67DRAFT_360803 [Paxillus ammoniavirescens]